MDALLQGLNAEQREAVLHDHASRGALLILAGAGSGKTSVLTRRIQYRIQCGVMPAHILALTFTAKAAAEMAERVGKLFPDAGVRLCTFHALALHLLRADVEGTPNWKRVGFSVPPVPADYSHAAWMDQLVALGCKPGCLHRDNLFASPLPWRYAQERLSALREPVLRSGKVVFEDLLWLSIHLLRNFAEVRAWCTACWTEILVDEYQDINPAQYLLVKTILNERKDLFVVGDDDQAIYGFRGADIGNIMRFRSDFPDCRVLRLEWNYRSTAAILSVANRIFADKDPALRKTLRSGVSRPYSLFRENRQPEIWNSASPLEEIERLITAIRAWREDYGLEWSAFAVLTRYNRQRIYYGEILREWGIPLRDENTENGVQVETLHASKGLQYPVVFYAGLATGLSPGELSGPRRARQAGREEEKRLFYVGVTRAEAHLVFLYCRQRFWRGALRVFKPSPFLKFCAPPEFGSGIPMPVILFKISVTIKVLCFLARRMPSYAWLRLRHPENIPAWITFNAERWAEYCLRVMRMELRVEGQEQLAKVDWSRPVIVVANHASYADIPVVLLAAGRLLGFLAKYELGFIPFLSYWMRQIGCIFVRRGKKGAGIETSRQLVQRKENIRVVIFPEGTRSRDGDLGIFKSGAFRMACDLNAVLLPIVHSGTREGWELRRDSRRIQPVRARILEPVDVAALADSLGRPVSAKSDLLRVIRDKMAEQHQALR